MLQDSPLLHDDQTDPLADPLAAYLPPGFSAASQDLVARVQFVSAPFFIEEVPHCYLPLRPLRGSAEFNTHLISDRRTVGMACRAAHKGRDVLVSGIFTAA